MWIKHFIGVGSYHCHHLDNHNVILVHVIQNIFSSIEDEVESSLFEKLEEDILQGLKWKQEMMKTRKKTYCLYSPNGRLNLDFKY
jgi:hypothetical protein